MKFSILIPHYRTGKMTAYCVSQLVKLKGKHELDIIIVDNSHDDSINHILLTNLRHECRVVNYPKDKMQSHATAYNHLLALGHVHTEYFITIESDSFPTEDNWLDYYEKLIEEGYDAAGSLLNLSGGFFMHVCGAMYKQSIWREMEEYCANVPYVYFPNMAMKDGFASHLMVHRSFMDEFTEDPSKFVKLHTEYIGKSPGDIILKAYGYEPICHTFHFGMGRSQESYLTYRYRTIESEARNVFFDGTEDKLIYRMGCEPGQLFGSWMLAKGYKIKYIPTKVQWMPNRENQQQEFTLNEVGFRHEWAVTAYNGCEVPELKDIIDFKANRMQSLYDSLPENFKL